MKNHYLKSLLLFSSLATSAFAMDYPVSSQAQFQSAITAINSSGGSNSITLQNSISLTTNLPAFINSSAMTTIQSMTGSYTISGSGTSFQPFFIDHGSLTIQNLTISTKAKGGTGGTGFGGGGGGAGLGGGLFVRGGTTATLSSVTLSGCNATGGTGGSVAGAGGGGGGGLFGSGGVGGPTPRGAGGGGGGVYGQGGSGRNVNIFGGGGGGGGGFFGNGGLGGGTTFGGGGGGGGYNASGGAATSGGGGGGGIAFAGGNGTGTTDAGGSGGGGLLATGASNSGQAGGAGGNGGGSGGGGAGGLPPAGAGGAFGGAGSGGNPGTVGGSSPNATDGGNGGPGGPGGSDGGGGGGGAGASGTASGIGGNGNSGGNGGANGGGGGGAQGGSGGSGHGGLGGSGGTGGAYGGGGGGGGGGGSTSSTPGAGGNGGNGYAVGGGQFSDGGGGGGGGASAIGVVSSGVGASGGNGAFGSGGGGSGFCEMTGNTVGNGGFGGGGGGAAAIEIVLPGGNGGFGGGGGSGNGGGTSPGGFGGTGGGNNGSGGGGAGLGGAIFLEYDSLNGAATLNINDGCSFSGNTVAAGTGGANNASALGLDIFMMYQTTLNITLDETSLTLLNPIESDGGAGGGSVGSGGLFLTGTGQTLTLNGSPTHGYGGGTSVGSSMTLALGSGTAAGVGTIALANTSTLQATASVTVPNAITTGGATIDTQTNNMTLSGGISGAGSITKIGSGILTITNSNSYMGATNINAGTLIVDGSLTATSMTTVAAGAALQGIGTISSPVTVSGTLQPGDSAVGTLNTGSLTFNNGSSLVIEVNPTQSALVNIGATGSTIDINPGSTLTVLLNPGSYTSGQTYTVIQAAKPGTLLGTFTTAVDIPPLFNVIVIYNPDPSVQILLERNPFASMGLKGNALAVANCFENATPTPGTDLDTVFIELLFAPSGKALQHAFNQIQPSQLNALQLSQENVNTRLLSVLSLREADLHRACKPQSETWGVWADAFGDAMHQDHQQGQYGFRAATGAALVGIDGQAMSRLQLGLGGAYTWTSLDWNGNHGDGDISSGYGFVYGTWSAPRFFLDASFIGGYNNYDVSRHIDFLAIDRHAKSEHHGYTLAGRLTGEVPFKVWKAEVTPLLSVDYDFVHQTAFNEHGAKSLNLQVHEKNANLLRAEAGFRVTRRCPNEIVTPCKSKTHQCVASSARWLPSFQLTVIREWRFQGARIRSKVSSLDCTFSSTGLNPDRTLIAPGAGLTYLLLDNTVGVSIDYAGEFDVEGKYWDQKGNFQISYAF